MSFLKEHGLTIVLSLILAGLVVVAVHTGWSVYQSMSMQTVATEEEVVDAAPDAIDGSELYEGVRREVAEGVEAARDTFSRERNYDEAIAQLRAQAENPDLNTDELGRLLLTQASQLLRVDPVAAAELFIDIYQDTRYANRIRAEAIEAINWHISSDLLVYSTFDEAVLRSGLAPRNFFTFIYGPEGLGFVSDDEAQTITLNQARQVFIDTFNVAIDLQTDRYISYALSAAEYGKLLTFEATDGEFLSDEILTTIDRIESVNNVARTGMVRYEESSIRDNRYDNGVAIVKFFDFRTAYYMYFAGLIDISELETKAQAVYDYVERFFSDNFTARVVAAATTEKYVIAFAHSQENRLSTPAANRITSLLEQYFYTLDDEDFERRAYSRYLGRQGELDSVRQQKSDSLKYIASSVDTNLQSILVEKIGGWTYADFE